jgi:hypothetical protein
MQDPHLRHRQFYEVVDHGPGLGRRSLIGRPYRLLHRDVRVRRRAPRFGEHNAEILEDLLGMGAEQIESLAAQGVLRTEPRNPGPARPWDLAESLRQRTLVAVDPDYLQVCARGDGGGEGAEAAHVDALRPCP